MFSVILPDVSTAKDTNDPAGRESNPQIANQSDLLATVPPSLATAIGPEANGSAENAGGIRPKAPPPGSKR